MYKDVGVVAAAGPDCLTGWAYNRHPPEQELGFRDIRASRPGRARRVIMSSVE